jgi:DNA-binding beta-propeller fold protein YncE
MPKAPTNFDHALIDLASRALFLADRSNSAVDVFTLQGELFTAAIGGFAGGRGPNGLALVPDRRELWAADGDSSVKVVDIAKRSVIATISTGGQGRADDLAYDARDKLVIVGNDSDPVPFLTFISAADRRVVGRLQMTGASGLEEVQWSQTRGVFYQAIPSTRTNPGGEVDAIDPNAMKVVSVFPLQDCEPHGLAIGPRDELLLGCGRDHTLIIDARSGAVVATIAEIGGADVVWFNPTANQYFVAGSATASGATRLSGPAVGVIDASTDRWIQDITTAAGAHSVVADAATNRVYVPIPGQGLTVLGPGYGVQGVDR